MLSFTNAAYSLLEEEGAPLSALKITKRALNRGLIVTEGKTPHQTMWASLYLENKRRLTRGEVPRFKQCKNNTWGLSKWDDA